MIEALGAPQNETPRIFTIQRSVDMDAPLLNDSETARQLGIKPSTLQNWRSTGRYNLPYLKVGGRVRYRQSDVDEWLTRRTRNHTGENSK